MCCVYLRQIPKQNEISNAYTQGVLHTGRTQAIHEEPAVRIKNKSREIFLPLFQCTLICNIIYHICMYDMYKYWCCACDICENYANLLENVLHAKCDLISPSEIAFPSTFPPLFAFAMRPLINAIFNFGEVRIKYANFPISANVIRSLCECVWLVCLLSVSLLSPCLFVFLCCLRLPFSQLRNHKWQKLHMSYGLSMEIRTETLEANAIGEGILNACILVKKKGLPFSF